MTRNKPSRPNKRQPSMTLVPIRDGGSMHPAHDTPLARLLEEQRLEAAQRRASLGPIVEAVGMLRACCETVRLLLDEMESSVGVHLELLDAVIRSRDGSRWWEQLTEETPGEDDRS
jgi:hypothetical protein